MPFLRNAWYMAMWSEGLPAGQLVPRTLLGEPVVLFRDAGQVAHALLDICPHRFAPLHRGTPTAGGGIRCGYHGLEFDAAGACVRNPHAPGHAPPPDCRVRAFPVVERHTIVWVWMGDRAPDPAAIPDYSFLDDDPPVASKRDFLVMNASYRLVIDNLLDLSHVPYLHDGLLGNTTTVNAELRVEQLGDAVFVSRDKFDARPPMLHDRLFRNDGNTVHAWQTIRWTPPSNLLNDSGVYPVDATRAEGAGLYGAHLLTPIDEHTTLYHFAAARHGVPLRDPSRAQELCTLLTEARRHAFERQDEPMIEAQQQVISRYPQHTARSVLLRSDAGVVRCNRLLDRLIDEEQGTAA